MNTLAQQAAELRDIKAKATDAESTAKALKLLATQAETEFFERMGAEGVGSIKVDGTNFVPVSTVYGQVQDRSAFITWAQENQPELLETKERKALVNEIVREHLDGGQALPDGLGFYVREYVSQRGSSE